MNSNNNHVSSRKSHHSSWRFHDKSCIAPRVTLGSQARLSGIEQTGDWGSASHLKRVPVWWGSRELQLSRKHGQCGSWTRLEALSISHNPESACKQGKALGPLWAGAVNGTSNITIMAVRRLEDWAWQVSRESPNLLAYSIREAVGLEEA